MWPVIYISFIFIYSSTEVLSVCNVAPCFSFLLYFLFLCRTHRLILDISLQDSKMLIFYLILKSSYKIPQNTMIVLVHWYSGYGFVQHLSSTIAQVHSCKSVLNHCSTGRKGLIILALSRLKTSGKGWRDVSPIQGKGLSQNRDYFSMFHFGF